MKDVRRTRAGRAAAAPPSEPDLVSRGMAQWRAERPDIDCSGKAIIGRILHLQGIILRAVQAALAPYGLRYPAYAVLATLRVAGAPYRMSSARLQATLLVTSGGLSNLLRRVERAGLIRRSDDPADRRGTIVELTATGYALVERAMPAHAAAERRLVAMLDAEEQRLAAALLSRVIVQNQPATRRRRAARRPPPRPAMPENAAG
jgi:DNA-binding MarR family transcriptional regulator